MQGHVPPSGLIHSLSCRPVAHATGKDMPPAGLVLDRFLGSASPDSACHGLAVKEVPQHER